MQTSVFEQQYASSSESSMCLMTRYSPPTLDMIG